ncbi:hypothetical protein HY641_01080 [Candidatus Woesearchaeota archaeon]|nr:hypothetical protein [Candidatus Woesearchaeota archaeon]
MLSGAVDISEAMIHLYHVERRKNIRTPQDLKYRELITRDLRAATSDFFYKWVMNTRYDPADITLKSLKAQPGGLRGFDRVIIDLRNKKNPSKPISLEEAYREIGEYQ